MYLSRHVVVDDTLGFKTIHMAKIKYQRPDDDLYLLMTTSSKEALFEIVKGKEAKKKKNNTSYVLAISRDYEWIKTCTASFVDALYNTKTLSYHDLESTK